MRYASFTLALLFTVGACASTPEYSYELDQATFNTWDVDDDGYVDESEWAQGFGEINLDRTWDVDGNGYIDNAEWTVGITDWDDYYDVSTWIVWDENDDDRLNQSEMAEGMFDTWDADENGFLDEAEFEVGRDLV